ncbi:MAG: hypothetical protein EZS28_047137 [Streblomastix strix]|uniref:Uncharacterized protein n=1 Tax=Streblomastix strix TaxID=222440 RepID=A0A5J4TFR1_9EUKA|nr:MAG: hypothetical protein EZS28_047137 [Streblomastix strix]
MLPENIHLNRLYSDPELGSHNIGVRDIASKKDSTRVWLDDHNGQEPDQHHADSRVLGLAMEHKNNDNINDIIPKEGSIEAIKASDGTSQGKETHKNKELGIGNKINPMHKSIIYTSCISHQVALKVDGQGSSQLTLEQVDLTQQPTINNCASRNLISGQQSRQKLPVHDGGNTNQRKPKEGVHTRRVEEQQPQEFQTTRNDAVPKALLEFRQELIQLHPSGIRSLTDNTVTMYCLNKGKGSIKIAPQVDKVFKQHVKVIQMRRLRNQERGSLKGTDGAWDLDLYRRICDTRESIMNEVLLYLQRQKTISEVKIERVSTAVLIAPEWPNQKWFTDL